MRDELIGPCASASGGTMVRPMPSASARWARKAIPPLRRWPNAKSGPQARCAAPRPPCSTSATNASAGSSENARSNGSSTTRSTPSAASAAARSPAVCKRNGGSSGRNTSRGCGSKVRTARGTSGRAPCAALSTCACPRCTPSKLPSANVAPCSRSASRQSCRRSISPGRGPAPRPRSPPCPAPCRSSGALPGASRDRRP